MLELTKEMKNGKIISLKKVGKKATEFDEYGKENNVTYIFNRKNQTVRIGSYSEMELVLVDNRFSELTLYLSILLFISSYLAGFVFGVNMVLSIFISLIVWGNLILKSYKLSNEFLIGKTEIY